MLSDNCFSDYFSHYIVGSLFYSLKIDLQLHASARIFEYPWHMTEETEPSLWLLEQDQCHCKTLIPDALPSTCSPACSPCQKQSERGLSR